jgi:hypothetical protein
MKNRMKLAFALGLGAAIALIARAGAGDIATLLSRAGWILLLLVLLARRGVGGTAAAASVIVEVFVALIAQFLFVALGLVCLAWRTGDSWTSYGLLAGLMVVIPVLGLMILALGSGAPEIARRMRECRQPLAVGKGFGIGKSQGQNVARMVQGRADEIESRREANRDFGMLV